MAVQKYLDPYDMMLYIASREADSDVAVDYILENCDINSDDPRYNQILQASVKSKSLYILHSLCTIQKDGKTCIKNESTRRLLVDSFKSDISLILRICWKLKVEVLPKEYPEIADLALNKTDDICDIIIFMSRFAREAPQYFKREYVIDLINIVTNCMKRGYDYSYLSEHHDDMEMGLSSNISDILSCLNKYNDERFNVLQLFRLVVKNADQFDDKNIEHLHIDDSKVTCDEKDHFNYMDYSWDKWEVYSFNLFTNLAKDLISGDDDAIYDEFCYIAEDLTSGVPNSYKFLLSKYGSPGMTKSSNKQ